VRTAAALSRWKQQQAVAIVTYSEVSRRHPRNTDAFHSPTLHRSPLGVQSEALLLQERQPLKRELQALGETGTAPSSPLPQRRAAGSRLRGPGAMCGPAVHQIASALRNCQGLSSSLRQVVTKYYTKTTGSDL